MGYETDNWNTQKPWREDRQRHQTGDPQANKAPPAELPAVSINVFDDISHQTTEETIRRCVVVLQEVSSILNSQIINNVNVLESNKGSAQMCDKKLEDAVFWMIN